MAVDSYIFVSCLSFFCHFPHFCLTSKFIRIVISIKLPTNLIEIAEQIN